MKRTKVLTANQIIASIHKNQHVSYELATHSYHLVCKALRSALSSGTGAELEFCGKLVPRLYQAKVGRNPKNPEQDIQIPSQIKVKFVASPSFKEELNKPVV